MPVLTVLAIVVFAGYAFYARVYPSSTQSGEVIGEKDIHDEASPSAASSTSLQPAPTVSPRPASSATVKSGSSKIDISVDTKLDNTTSGSEKIVYPGAISTGGNSYETDVEGDTVYNWYKSELNSRSYQIRNNVKTKANDKFKAILQGASNENSIKVTIDQENEVSKTIITLE